MTSQTLKRKESSINETEEQRKEIKKIDMSEIHIYFYPLIINDMEVIYIFQNVKYIFHLHRFKLLEISGYFHTTITTFQEEDLKCVISIPEFTDAIYPYTFLKFFLCIYYENIYNKIVPFIYEDEKELEEMINFTEEQAKNYIKDHEDVKMKTYLIKLKQKRSMKFCRHNFQLLTLIEYFQISKTGDLHTNMLNNIKEYCDHDPLTYYSLMGENYPTIKKKILIHLCSLSLPVDINNNPNFLERIKYFQKAFHMFSELQKLNLLLSIIFKTNDIINSKGEIKNNIKLLTNKPIKYNTLLAFTQDVIKQYNSQDGNDNQFFLMSSSFDAFNKREKELLRIKHIDNDKDRNFF